MGNDASQPVRNLDKRTARRRYRDDFADAIAEWRVEQGVYPYPASPPRGGGGKRESEGDDESGLRPIRVFVRKRPIHPEEVDAGEFDVISCCEFLGRSRAPLPAFNPWPHPPFPRCAGYPVGGYCPQQRLIVLYGQVQNP